MTANSSVDGRSGHGLHAADVEAVYTRLLGRAPSADELRHQLDNAEHMGQLLDGVIASPEYAEIAAYHVATPGAAPAFANIWTPELDAWTHPLGTVSPDGVVEVGRRGTLFIRGGSNDNRAHFSGEAALPARWAEDWQRAVRHRERIAEEFGASVAWLVVPDKLAVAGHFLSDHQGAGIRPVQRLLDAVGETLLYPLAELADVGADAYMRTDSHLTLEGNRVLAWVVADRLGAEGVPEIAALEPQEHLRVGDLGSHFQPPIVEVMRVAGHWPAEVVSDNWPAIHGAGGHVGTRRVIVNGGAPDPRRVVVFGDSYGFGGEAYQGLSWWLSHVFREIHFVWLPFGWDSGYLERVRPDAVVVQGAERFCVRAPAPDSDTALLAEKTLSRGRGILLDELEAATAD